MSAVRPEGCLRLSAAISWRICGVSDPPYGAVYWLCVGTAAFVEDVVEHVVGDVGHADFHHCPVDANDSGEERHLVLLHSEHMLDGGPDL